LNVLQTLRDTPKEGVKQVYHVAYHTIANQLIEQGNSESQASTVIQGLKKSAE